MDIKRHMRLLLFMGSLVIALALAIAACGATPGGAATGHVPAAQSGATPASTASAATSPSQSIHEAGPMVLVSSATHYAISDTITITVQNTTGRTIYARTSFTGCSIIALAYRTGSSWQPIHLCADGFPHPSITPIAPGGNVTIRLAAATASSDASGSETAQWPAGTYRASLTYTTSADESFSRGTTTYSSTFVVGG